MMSAFQSTTCCSLTRTWHGHGTCLCHTHQLLHTLTTLLKVSPECDVQR